jgi:hypothetical protein
LALRRRQARIARLRYRCSKSVQHANIQMLRRHAPQFAIQSVGVAPRQLRHVAHSQQLKIAHHRWTDGNQIRKAPVFGLHKNLLDKKLTIPYTELV